MMGYQTWILTIFLIKVTTSASGEKSRDQRAAGDPAPHFKIGTILEKPYTMMMQGQTNQYDYEGFIPDLIDGLASSMGFTYEFSLSKDGKYGMCQEMDNQTKCTGLIGEVFRKEVDIAAAPLTVTRFREHHVDFVRAFQNLGITAMMKRPRKNIPNGWSLKFDILRPMKLEVYVVVFAAGLVVGLVLWLMNRYNPYEWGCQRHLADEEAGSRFNLSGSFWFVFASLQWQGFDKSPRSMASRVLTVFWFMFVTVTLVTYIGSLLNHLFWASNVQGDVDNVDNLPRSIQEMVKSRKYEYGAVHGGATENLLRLGRGEMYHTIRDFWANAGEKSMFTRSTNEGIKRVLLSDNYTFFMESATAKYHAHRNCDLVVINDIIHPRSLALAVSQGFKHLDSLHISMLELLESGTVAMLEKKWWENTGKCLTKKDSVKKGVISLSRPMSVGLDSFWGALVLIAVGLALSLLTAAAEIIFFRLRGQNSKTGDGGQQLTAPIYDDQQA